MTAVLCDFSSKLLSRYGKGQQTRPFCYVDNLIDGLIKLKASGQSVTGGKSISTPERIFRLVTWSST
jgi:nucleoside-diphosphate-sugar epimerase